MVPQDLLLPALIAVVIANIVLIIAALILASRRRRQAAAVPAPVVASTSAASARPAGFGAAGLPRMVEPAPATGTYTDALTGLLLPVPFARLAQCAGRRYRRRSALTSRIRDPPGSVSAAPNPSQSPHPRRE